MSSQVTLQERLEQRRPSHAGKDWSLENTREIPWARLMKFLRRHAETTDGFIRETFIGVNYIHSSIDRNSSKMVLNAATQIYIIGCLSMFPPHNLIFESLTF